MLIQGEDVYFLALATDYDGTLACEGHVETATIDALARVKRSGRKLILVTGRKLADLMRVFPQHDMFEIVVAENGALLYAPDSKEEVLLAEPPPEPFVKRLRETDVIPLDVGRIIVATCEPNQGVVLEAIRDLGLDLHIVFNKGAVMVASQQCQQGVGPGAGLVAAGVVGAQRRRDW